MKFVWPPLMKTLDERAKKIADGLAAAEKSKNDLSAAQNRIAQADAQLRAEQQTRLSELEKQSAALIEQAKHDAETERARILAQAQQDAEQEVNRVRDGLRTAVAELAVKGAEQILKREINAAAHAELLTQLKTQLKV